LCWRFAVIFYCESGPLEFCITTDFLLFDDTERGPDDELRLQFDVIARLDDEEKRVIRELIDGMILKYQARRWAGIAPAPAPAKATSGAKRKAHTTAHR
jgi:hypothetical protein